MARTARSRFGFAALVASCALFAQQGVVLATEPPPSVPDLGLEGDSTGAWERAMARFDAASLRGDPALARDTLLEAVRLALRFDTFDVRIDRTTAAIDALVREQAQEQRFDEAVAFLRAVEAEAVRHEEKAHVLLLHALERRARIHLQQLDGAAAEAAMTVFLERAESTPAPDEFRLLGARVRLAEALGMQGRLSEARTTLRPVLESGRLNPDSQERLEARLIAATLELEEARLSQGISILEELQESRVGLFAAVLLGQAQLRDGDLFAASAAFHRAEQQLRMFPAGQTPLGAKLLVGQGIIARLQGELVRAIDLHSRALEQAEEDARTAFVLIELADSYRVAGHEETAQQLVDRARAIVERRAKEAPASVVSLLARLAEVEARLGRHREAVAHADTAVRQAARIHGKASPALALHRVRRADVYLRAGKTKAAAKDAEPGVAVLKSHFGPDHVVSAESQAILARVRAAQDRHDEALALFEAPRSVLEQAFGQRSPLVAEILAARAVALQETGKTEQARRDEERVAAIRRGFSVGVTASQVTGRAEFEEFNFRLEHSDPDWHPMDPARAGPDSRVAYYRSNPNVVFAVVVEPLGPGDDPDPAEFKERLRTAFENSNESVELVGERERSVADIDGVEMRLRIISRGVPYLVSQWAGFHGQWLYRLVAYTTDISLGEVQLSGHAEEMIASFSLIDPEVQRASAPPGPHFASERFGYSVDLREGGWQAAPDVAAIESQAEFGAIHPAGALLVVLPVSLLGTQPSDRAVFDALLRLLEQSWPESSRPVHSGEVGGIEFDFVRILAGKEHSARARLLRSPETAYAVVALAVPQHEALLGVLDSVAFAPVSGPIEISSLSERERSRHVHLFNGMGLATQRGGNRAEAIRFFGVARELRPDDLVLLENLVQVQVAAGRYAEALAALEGPPERFEKNLELLAYRAFARQQTGDQAGALADYGAAFERGFEDERLLSEYVGLLWQAGEREQAFRALDAAIEAQGSVALRTARATLHLTAGAHEEAIAELKAIESQGAADASVYQALALAYFGAARYRDAVEVCGRYEKAYGGSPDVLVLKARAQSELGRFEEADATLDRALELAPESAAVKEFKALLASALGKGDRTLLREPIEPVGFPSQLVQGAALDSTALAQHGGGYVHWVEAVRFEEGEPRRRTFHLRGRVADTRGADPLSNLQFEFEPAWERIWLNDLVVRGASGEVLARREAANLYVTDRADEAGIASSAKVLHVAIPGLRAGATFEVVVTRSELASERFRLIDRFLTRDMPVGVAALFVAGDTGHLDEWTSSGVERLELDGGIAWLARSLAPLKWEPLLDDSFAHLPRVLVGDDRDSWETLAQDYIEELAPFVAPGKRVDRLAEELLEGAAGASDKRARAVRYVQENLTYKALAFGVRARIPHQPEEILENRFGDCKDHSVLLVQLLKRAGFPAQLALVSAGLPIEPAVASLEQFDHMIVHCERCGSSGFLDVTDKDVDPADVVPRGLGGRLALVLDPERPRLVRVPGYADDRHTVRIDRDIAIREDGGVSVVEDVILTGHWGASMRGTLRAISLDQWKELLQQQIFADHRGSVLRRVEARHLEDPAEPLEVKLEYDIGGWFSPGDSRRTGRIPAVVEALYLEATPVDDRRNPFQIRYPLRLQSSARLRAPQGFIIGGTARSGASPPAAKLVKFEGSSEPSGDALRVRFQAVVPSGRHPADDYAAYYQEMLGAIRFFDGTVELVRR